MENDSRLLYIYVPSVTAIFLITLFVSHHTQDKRISSLEAQLKTANATIEAAKPEETPRNPEASTNQTATPTQAAIPEEAKPKAPETNQPQQNQAPVQSGDNVSIDSHIQQDNKEIADLQARLHSLQSAPQPIDNQANNGQTNSTAAHEATNEKDGLGGEQASIRRRLLEVQGDINFWLQKQVSEKRNLQAQ